MFTGLAGSDAKEWQAWLDLEGVEVLDEAEDDVVEVRKDAQVVPLRWVRTNKNEDIAEADLLAKSRLVAVGLRDQMPWILSS